MWKKWSAILLAVMLLTCSFGAGAQRIEQSVDAKAQYVVELPDSTLIVDQTGEEVVKRGSFGMLYELTGLPDGIRRYAAEPCTGGMNALYALLDENGQPLTGHDYMMLEYAGGAVMFMKNELLGVMDLQGNVVIEAEYTYIVPCGDGNYLALRTNPYDDSADMVYHVSADGSERATGNKTALLGEFDEAGLCAAMSPDTFKYGYLDAQGQWAITPRFEWAGGFVNGQAAVNTADGAGLIDLQGNWLIRPEYDYVTFEGDSLIVAANGNTIRLIDPETLQIAAEYSGSNLYAVGIRGGRAGVMQADVLKVIDRTGAELFSIENCTSLSLWNGMENEMIVMLGGSGSDTAQLFGTDGTRLAGGYQDIMPLGMGDEGMHYMFVTYEATQVVYDNGLSFWDEIPGTRRCGVLNAKGEELCSFEADYISWCGDGYIVIHQESGRVFADIHGNVIAEFEDLNRAAAAMEEKQYDSMEDQLSE